MKTILVDAVYCFIIEDGNGKFRIFEEMQKLLDSYPNKKIILTSAPEEKFKLYCLDRVPYEFFTLKQNPPKANPDYYRRMLEHFRLNREDVVYFEHAPEAVKSAETAGIKSYLYNNSKNDLKALKGFLDSCV